MEAYFGRAVGIDVSHFIYQAFWNVSARDRRDIVLAVCSRAKAPASARPPASDAESCLVTALVRLVNKAKKALRCTRWCSCSCWLLVVGCWLFVVIVCCVLCVLCVVCCVLCVVCSNSLHLVFDGKRSKAKEHEASVRNAYVEWLQLSHVVDLR